MHVYKVIGLGSWCLMPLTTIVHVYRDGQFYWWMKTEYPEKIINKLYHLMFYRVNFHWSGFELTTSVVIYTECIGSCKSNYHTITTMAAPCMYILLLDDNIV